MVRTISLAVVIVCAAAAATLGAQATAAINGRVVDQVGAVLPGAIVTVTNTATGVTRETASNAEGLYSVPALDRGSYDVQASLSGFAPSTRRGVELLAASTLTVDFQMGLAALRESVTVAAQAPLIETTQSGVSSSIQQTEVAQLPMLNRTFAAMLTLLPGAREVPVGNAASHGHASSYVSFGGGSGRNFNMLVDGVDNKDDHDGGTTMVYSLEGVQEFRAFTSSFSAEYGKAPTTVIVATKSGANRTQGSAFAYGRNDALTATDYFSAPEHGGTGKQPFSRVQFGASVGGAIAKDRAWYFGSLERVQQDFTLPRPDNLYQQLLYLERLNVGAVASHAIFQPFRDLLTQAKTNLQMGPHHSAFVRYATQVGHVDNPLTLATPQSRALLACCPVMDRNSQTMWNLSSGWTWVMSPTTVNQLTAQYLYYDHDEHYPPCDPATCLAQRLNFPTVGSGALQAFPDWHNLERKIEVKNETSMQRGAHAWKVGVDYSRLPKFGGINALSSPGSITFFDDPSVIVNNTNGRYPLGFQTPGIVRAISVTTGTAPIFDILDAWSLGAYLQDDFKITPRVTLNVGLRYDVYEFMDQPELDRSRIYRVLAALGSPYGRLPSTDTNNLAPRTGVAWDVDGTGKNVVRGGFGLFYGQGIMQTYISPTFQMKPTLYYTQTYANSAIGVGQLAGFVYGVSPLPTAPLAPTELPVGQSVAASWYDPALKDPVTIESHAGYSHAFPHETVLSVDYTHLVGHNGWRNLNINSLLVNPANPSGPRLRPLSADTLRVDNDPSLLGPVNLTFSVNRSLYDEVAVHFERRFSQAAAFQANYTLAWARGMGGVTDGPGGASPQTPSASGGDIYAPWEWGPAAYDERHRITLAGVFTLPFDITVSPSFTAASARAYSQFRAVNPSGDGSLLLLGADGNPVPVNSARGIPLVNANARVTKSLGLGGARSLALFAELYNVLNRANFGNMYNGNAFSPATYNQPNGYLGGIASTSTIPISFQVQFGGRLSF